MLFDVGHQLPLVRQGQDLNVIFLAFGWKDNINLMSRHKAMLDAIPENHLEHDQNVSDGLLAEPGGQFPVHQILHVIFLDIFPVSQFRQQMALDEQAVSCVG